MRNLIQLQIRMVLLLIALTLAAPALAAASVTLRAALPALRESTPEVRQIFVETAVTVLSERFLDAAQASAQDSVWARNTRGFVADLWRAVDAARAGGAVRIIADQDDSLRVVVGDQGGRQFTLMPPRPAERAQVEAEILRRLCLSVDCSYIERTFAVNEDAGRPSRAGDQRGSGIVADRRPQHGDDGLRCAKGTPRHARLRAAACARLVDEIRAFVHVLERSVASGIVLDWSVLTEPLWRKRGTELLVDAHGASVTVSAPLLGRYPTVLNAVMPWVRARLAGHSGVLEVEPPARLIYAARHDPSSP